MASISIRHFSTVNYIKNLRQANFTEDQAEALAKETELLIANILEQTQLESEKKDLATRKDLEQAKNQILIWMFGMLTGFAAFFLAILAKGFHWW